MFEFLQFIADWLNTTIYTFFVDAIAYLFSTLFILWLKMKLYGLEFAWDVSKAVISNLGISTLMQSAWAAIPPDAANTARFFKLPESLNLLITAGVTRLTMSFLPGF